MTPSRFFPSLSRIITHEAMSMNNNAYVSSKAVKGCIWTCKQNVIDPKLYFVCLKLLPSEHKFKKTEIVLSVTLLLLLYRLNIHSAFSLILNTYSLLKYKILYLQTAYSYVYTHYSLQ